MAKKQPEFNGEVLHFHATRMRVTGSGVLRQTFYSLDDIRSQAIANQTLAGTTRIEPTTLANFSEQRAYLDIRTTAIDEYFTISKIIIYARPVAASYPQ